MAEFEEKAVVCFDPDMETILSVFRIKDEQNIATISAVVVLNLITDREDQLAYRTFEDAKGKKCMEVKNLRTNRRVHISVRNFNKALW